MKVYLKGLTCANCAGKIETAVNALNETKDANINLVKQTMDVSLVDGVKEANVLERIEKIVHKLEPEVEVSLQQNKQTQEASCSCGHCHEDDHSHKENLDHGHDHADNHGEEGENKKIWLRFGGGGVLFLAAVVLRDTNLALYLYLISYGVFGYDVLIRACRNILRGQIFDENFLMSISTVGAIAIGEMPEAVFVMMFYQVGEAFQDYAVRRSRKSITSLLDIRPDFAEVIAEGSTKRVHPEEVNVGDFIL